MPTDSIFTDPSLNDAITTHYIREFLARQQAEKTSQEQSN